MLLSCQLRPAVNAGSATHPGRRRGDDLAGQPRPCPAVAVLLFRCQRVADLHLQVSSGNSGMFMGLPPSPALPAVLRVAGRPGQGSRRGAGPCRSARPARPRPAGHPASSSGSASAPSGLAASAFQPATSPSTRASISASRSGLTSPGAGRGTNGLGSGGAGARTARFAGGSSSPKISSSSPRCVVGGPVPPGPLQRLPGGDAARLDVALSAAHAAPAGRTPVLQLVLPVPGHPVLDVRQHPEPARLALQLGQPSAAPDGVVGEPVGKPALKRPPGVMPRLLHARRPERRPQVQRVNIPDLPRQPDGAPRRLI